VLLWFIWTQSEADTASVGTVANAPLHSVFRNFREGM